MYINYIKYLILIISIIILITSKKKYNFEKFSNNSKVNIVMSCDKNQFIGILATVNSICNHSNKKFNQINFYFLVNKNEKTILDNLIKKVPYEIDYKIKEIYQDNEIQDNIRVNSKISNVDNIMNFIRFNFTEELPNLNKILYIDADIIIKDDIIQLYHNCNINKSPFYAVKINNFKNIDDIKDLSLYNPYADYFNAGLYITSLKYWRENNLKFKGVELMKKHKNSKKGLFRLGTQPILNILFHENFTKINKAWNTGGLGFKKVELNKIKNAKGLHWTGPKKPWNKDGLYKEYWEPYNLL